MIRKLLIANRGEIACRIIRTCRSMGIASIAVYSDADAGALHVELADEAINIGPAPVAESYLNGPAVIAAAQRAGADALHPGYGFLSENAAFAASVIDAGLIWIGPSPQSIASMGDKRRAKLLLANIPLVPGYTDEDQSDGAFLDAAEAIGLPVMIKAAAGGGGRGMRLVSDLAELPAALEAARREAAQAFGDPTLMIEKAIVNPRHVEVQIIGDHHGRVIALGERECSIQRRHQKVIEEAPSIALDDDLRARMCATAVQIGEQIGYVNAGTVEFILDAERSFYFLEMNTRLQVEHPVTELIYGIDLVRWQIEIAEGARLDQLAASLHRRGHAIEARVYAEDPANQFLPVTGEIVAWRAPEGVRIDSGVRSGTIISPYYDPLIAKVIAYGSTRAEAIRRLDRALANLCLLGLRANVAFLRRVILHPAFHAGEIDTGFIDRYPELVAADPPPTPAVLIAAALTRQGSASGWRNNPYRPARHHFRWHDTQFEVLLAGSAPYFTAQIDDTRYEVHARASQREDDLQEWELEIDGHRRRIAVATREAELWLHADGTAFHLCWQSPLPTGQTSSDSTGSLRSPMPGQVIKIDVETGQVVRKGDILLVIEAMKMEHRIKAPYDGRVVEIYYAVGQTVEAGVKLLELDASI
ncbi:MAG: biotin carboxylase N-terminal domain-containing protein [Aggregatilineales bacterium]